MVGKIKDFYENPKSWRRIHASFALFWLVMIIPTMLLWPESILWIALLSVWANVGSEFEAFQSSRAQMKAPKSDYDHWWQEPKFWVVYHGVATVVWLFLIIPTLTIWQDSVVWVAFMSVYAAHATHLGSFHASGAEKESDEENGSNDDGESEPEERSHESSDVHGDAGDREEPTE